jgi:hypothetical protein
MKYVPDFPKLPSTEIQEEHGVGKVVRYGACCGRGSIQKMSGRQVRKASSYTSCRCCPGFALFQAFISNVRYGLPIEPVDATPNL